MQPEEREAYESRLKWYRLQKSSLKKQFEDGVSVGKAEGLTEGKTDMAKKLLKKGVSISDIAEVSGMAHAEIQKLAE